MLVVFDLDGTIADVRHRMHHIKPNPSHDPVTGKRVPRRYDLFHAACGQDGVIHPVAQIYEDFVRNPDVTVIVLSGRDHSEYDKTVYWFQTRGLLLPDELILKQGDQMVPDTEQKARIADELEAKYGRKISMVFDDRDRVVKMWKERGTFVFNVEQAV